MEGEHPNTQPSLQLIAAVQLGRHVEPDTAALYTEARPKKL